MKRAYVITLILFILGCIWFFDLGKYLTFDNLKTSIEIAQRFYHKTPFLFMVYYFFFYIFVSALPMPGAITMALLGGIIMGFAPALFLVSFGSALGASIAMLLARYLFRDLLEYKFHSLYTKVQKGVHEDGVFYVVMLRLLPIPFFIVNIMLGLTPISFRVFYVASQLSLLPSMALIVRAGAELGLIRSPRDIFSPIILILFTVMAVFPFIAKKVILFLMKKREEEFQR